MEDHNTNAENHMNIQPGTTIDQLVQDQPQAESTSPKQPKKSVYVQNKTRAQTQEGNKRSHYKKQVVDLQPYTNKSELRNVNKDGGQTTTGRSSRHQLEPVGLSPTHASDSSVNASKSFQENSKAAVNPGKKVRNMSQEI